MGRKISNRKLKTSVENFIIEKLENCELFVKTYGKGFARERLKTNLKGLRVIGNNAYRGGEYSIESKMMTLCSSRL